MRRWSNKRPVPEEEAAERRCRRCVWTEAEDRLLLEMARAKPTGQWAKIAKAVSRLGEKGEGGKTPKQCRERWHNCLDPNIKSAAWTLAEQTRFFELHQRLGPKWATIASELGGRTDNTVKNYFYCQLRKIARRIHKSGGESSGLSVPAEGALYLAQHLRTFYLNAELPTKEHLRDRYVADMVKKKMITPSKIDAFVQALLVLPRCSSDTEDSMAKGQIAENHKLPPIPTEFLAADRSTSCFYLVDPSGPAPLSHPNEASTLEVLAHLKSFYAPRDFLALPLPNTFQCPTPAVPDDFTPSLGFQTLSANARLFTSCSSLLPFFLICKASLVLL